MYVGTYPLPECITRAINPKYHSSQCWLLCMFHSIMEYGSTPYVGMAQEKMAATSNVLCGSKDLGMVIRKSIAGYFLPCWLGFHPYIFFRVFFKCSLLL